MFNYLELTTEEVIGNRWYVTPEGSFPSITTILSNTMSAEKAISLENWRQGVGEERAARETQIACDRGTIIHLMVERHLKGENPIADVDGIPIDKKEIGSFNALKLSLRAITQIYAQEVALYSTFYEVAGRVDLVGKYKGVESIVDFKTSRRIKSKSEIYDYCLQMLFYADAHNEMYGTDIQQGVVIMVSDFGMPQVFVFKFTNVDRTELKRRAELYWDKAAQMV